MSYKLYLFDLDGTLINSRHSIVSAFEAVARDLGIEGGLFPDGETFIGYTLDEVFRKLDLSDTERARELYRHHYYRFIHTETAFPGITETLKRLHGSICMSIVTNKASRGCRASLLQTNLLSFFDCCEAVDTCIPKPHKDSFDRICAFYKNRGLSFEPHECLMIGDSPVDMAYAANAGIDCAFVSWGFYKRDALPAEPTYIISNPIDLCLYISK
jgi:phosphoglycolate phosphatase-like HAD superfamily hydrolase